MVQRDYEEERDDKTMVVDIKVGDGRVDDRAQGMGKWQGQSRGVGDTKQ